MRYGNRLRAALSVMALAIGAASTAPAQGAPTVIAVLPFEDRGSYGQPKEVFRALALGIPATIATELRGHAGLRLADENRIARALKSEKLGPNAQVDAATAARIAKQVGARYAVTGNFSDFYGKFRLDARVVDAESGQIIKVFSNKDPKVQDRSDLYRIIQLVGHQVLGEISPSALRGGSPEMEARSIPTEALTQYSLGLLYENQGDKNRAADHYQRALTTFPDYSDAREGARRVGGP